MILRTNNVRPRKAIDRMLDKVEIITETGCWIFTGAVNDFGYGIVGLGKRGSGCDRAHRISYRHFVGEIPSGLVVCHKCDIPSCCNPNHLFLGTHADNHADMVRKGRQSLPPRNHHDRGEHRYNAKLTEDDVREIRKSRKLGESVYSIAKRMGHSYSCISKAAKGYTWRHVWL